MSTHQNKQRIFDEYAAQFEEFGNFEGMIDAVMSTVIHKEEFIYRIFECCDLIQEEQQKRIAENAELNDSDGEFVEINKKSITNPENKIQ